MSTFSDPIEVQLVARRRIDGPVELGARFPNGVVLRLGWSPDRVTEEWWRELIVPQAEMPPDLNDDPLESWSR